MTTTALYKALIEANVSPETAERAVEGLAAADEAATKADIAALKVDMLKWAFALFLGFFLAISITNIGAVYTMLQALK